MYLDTKLVEAYKPHCNSTHPLAVSNSGVNAEANEKVGSLGLLASLGLLVFLMQSYRTYP